MCQASSTCEVEFVDNPMKVFYSGQLMRGTVQLNIVKQKKVRRIYIHVYGAAYASWTEYFWFDFGLQNWCSDYQKTFSGKEVYLNDGTYFVGAPENNNEFKPLNCWQRIFKMVPGVHDYTFEFKLPSDLPTSIEGKHGNIRYTAIFVIDAIYPEKRKTLKIPFTVLRPFDLNADPEFRNPIVAEMTTKYPMNIIVRTPVQAYTPGQIINIEIDVNNHSDKSIVKFSVHLMREIIYYKFANSKRYKSERTSVVKTKTRGCDKYENISFFVPIPIPPIPPTDLLTSNIVKVRYCICIVGSIDSVFHSNPILEFPITIGTYPIRDVSCTLSNQNNDATIDSPTSGNESVTFANDDVINNPLSYEETLPVYSAVFNNVRPKYLMFKQATSYSTEN